MNDQTTFLRTTYFEISPQNIQALIDYLKNLGGKPLSPSSRKQNAFKVSWASHRDYKLYVRSHIQNAAEYLTFLKNDYKEKQIKIVIADIEPYIANLDSNEDTSFMVISPNTLPSAIHFSIAEKLFLTHQIRPGYQDNYSVDLLSLYGLRLSLESRVRNLLGIDTAINGGKIIGLNSLINVATKLKSVEFHQSIKWNEIKWINNWLNHYIHRHLRPHPWVTYLAFKSLKSFINPKYSLKKEGRKILSINNAAYVINEENMGKEIYTALKKEYSEIEIRWKKGREITKPPKTQ